MIAQTSAFGETANSVGALSGWVSPPTAPVLNGDEVHVWRTDLGRQVSHSDTFSRMLSEEERTRAGRFYFRKDREEFLVARGLLRSILSRYVGAEPHRLQFSCAPHGKPALAHARGDESIRFNVSHSHGVMLCAVARNREVGVDVELIRPGVAAQMPAECDSTLPGLRDILALPEKDRSEAFFACWTRKEAYLKARGEGLAKARGRSAMCLAHDAGVTGIISDGIRSWTYRRLVPSPRHIGALIVEKKDVCCKRDITVVQFGMDTIDR